MSVDERPRPEHKVGPGGEEDMSSPWSKAVWRTGSLSQRSAAPALAELCERLISSNVMLYRSIQGTLKLPHRVMGLTDIRTRE